MALGVKLIPLNGINLDVANAYLPPNQARFIKNLYYQLSDTAEAGTEENSETGKLKPIEATAVYCPFTIPSGDNTVIGTFSSRDTAELYVFVHNSLENHFIFRLNGLTQTADVTAPNPDYNFKLQPQYFIGEGQCYLEINTFVDPATGAELVKKDLYWTTGETYQGFIRFDDYLNTNGYSPSIAYFAGNYDRATLVRVGLPTPIDCVTYTEVTHTEADDGINNELLFQGLQLRITPIDVFGRPSEHGIISDLYIPGVNDCISASNNLPRCLDLSIFVGNPLWDKIQIEFSNDNSIQWYLDSVLNLYNGSSLGEWWKRERNTDLPYDNITQRITYRFCHNKGCDPIPQAETNKLQPSLAKRSQAVGKVGKKLAFANNKYNFNPFSQDLLSKIGLTITPPKKVDVPVRNITVYVPIWNDVVNEWEQVNKVGTTGYTWGGGPATAFSQYMKNPKQSGFLGYLVGGGTAISSQVYVDANEELQDDPLFIGRTLSPLKLTFQKFVFTNVSRGTYIFRLAATIADINTDVNYRETSTTVWGLCPFDRNGWKIYAKNRDNPQELVIDVCDGDYDSLDQNQLLVVMSASSNKSKAISGYLYETQSNGFNQNPIELAAVRSDNLLFRSNITDHNGFYYYGTQGSGRNFEINIIDNCVIRTITSGQNGGVGMLFRNFYADVEFSDYNTHVCNHINVVGRLTLQGSNIGISNATVALTRGGIATTDNNGFFTIRAHDEVDFKVRGDSVIILAGGCAYTGQDGACLPTLGVAIIPCRTCGERVVNTGITILQYIVQKGLLSGGSYIFGFTGYDWLGRKTAEQIVKTFTMPSIIQNGTIGASTIAVEISPDALFPPEIVSIVPSITAETTQSDYLDWIVDSVKFTDNTGDEVTSVETATQIRIYYGSVIEYNKQNNYNTTTIWQFISSGTQTPEIADKVQFFINGDGKFFTKTIIGLVKYALDGQYFIIDYTSDLADLKANAYIRLIRPKVCTGSEPFYEVCQPIPIVNRRATINSFVLNAFDTYYLTRQIPVPVLVPAVPPATVDTYINELRIPGFSFEHHSPSNFWGYKIWNRGRLNVKNPYESEILMPDEIQLSGVVSVTGQLSYLQNFDEDGKKNFIISNSGGITYFNVKSGVVCFVTQFNNFVVGYNDNLARLVNGNLQVPSGDSTFGNPERKPNGDYGCLLFDKSTIREREGIINFLDTSRVAFLQHDFNECYNVAAYNKANSTIVSWLTKKVKYVQEYNRTNDKKIFFHGVINPANFEYILTDFKIGSSGYVNQERQYVISKSESIALDMFGKVWKGFYSATPEYYGFIEGEKNGQQLFLFKNSVPYYIYKSNEAGTYGVVFGEVVERVYEFILTTEIMKKQSPLGMQVYCKESGYFADRIITEMGQESRILKSHFNQGMFMYAASFLRDVNTPTDINIPDQADKKILEGNPLYGEWIKVRLIGYPESNEKYSQLSGIQVFVNGENNTGK